MRRFAAWNFSISIQLFLALSLLVATFGCAGGDDDDDSGATDDDVAGDDDATSDDDLADDDADDDWIPPTTLDLTLVPEPDDAAPLGYSLVEGPGEPREIRNDLGVEPTRDENGAEPLSMAYYLSMADFQLTDEESPTRLTFFDSNQIVGGGFSAAYRPHEDVSPHLVNSLIRTANAIQSGYGRDFDFAVVLGDLTDNAQHNEMALVIDVFDANGITTGVPGWARPDSGDLDIDPDTGRNRGERNFGIQEEDGDGNSINAFDRPGLPNSNADFPTVGLRRADGSQVPWLAVLGNHDVLNTGNFDPDSGLTFYSREDYVSALSHYGYISGVAAVIQYMQDNPGQPVYIDGGIFGLDLDWQTVLDLLNLLGLVPDDLSADLDGRFDMDVLLNGTYDDPSDDGVPITPDPGREFLGRDGSIAILHEEGHGFIDRNDDGVTDGADGGWYALDWVDITGQEMPLRFLVLDTTDAGLLAAGGISNRQFEWIEDELDRAEQDDVLVIVNSHHAEASTPNGGDRLTQLLGTCPNVILHQIGHGHENAIIAHHSPTEDPALGYWEVQTPSTIDFPQQGRVVELVDYRDGTGSILLTLFDHWGIVGDDSDTLGETGRELAFEDAIRKGYEGGASLGGMGGPADRNRELVFAIPPSVADRLASFDNGMEITSAERLGN
ncbi:MAG: hypothetical protein IT350_06985 [Deltaproteobacteria bacterium]|nr:hypothetical protein [Deltaproteobacteria bacterium]